MAVGVSGSAFLILLVISTMLCCLPFLFSFRKLPGDMVSGGTNSLVLSAACHVSVEERLRQLRSAVPSPTTGLVSGDKAAEQHDHGKLSSNSRHQRQPTIFNTDANVEQSRVAGDSRIDASAQPSTVSLQIQNSREDEERLLPDMTPEESEEYELSLLQEVARSRIRWGAVAAGPEILQGLDVDEPVMHLGFGTEEDNVQPPQEGHLYI